MQPSTRADSVAGSTRRPVRAWLGRSWLWLFGWRVEGGRPDARKAVVIAYPHTTNWDLPFMLAVAYALDLDIRWLGKHTLFRAPFGWAMRRLGGISVDRRSRGNNVDAIVETLNPMEDVLVVIPPEGTRSHAGRWKSGFYWVAVGAELPIVLGFLDYSRKCGGLGEILYPTGDPETDLVKMREFYEGIDGKFPERTGAISFDDV